MTGSVLTRAALDSAALSRLLGRYGACLVDVALDAPLPGSYWGAPEAGLVVNRVYVRGDTPAHSVLHELSHYVCMTADRRSALNRDAGGDPDEECAVCYLQLVLADELPGFGRERCCDDMDAWGYRFREGSVRAWLGGDAEDAKRWLLRRSLVDTALRPTWRLR